MTFHLGMVLDGQAVILQDKQWLGMSW